MLAAHIRHAPLRAEVWSCARWPGNKLARRRYEKLVERLESRCGPPSSPSTRLVAGRLFILDEREVPEAIKQLAEKASVEAMNRAWREHQ
ncbi:hypothetical protein [Streptomyces niveus]|uniref:hypothetical protein n=1 Tax=Streptomyces niveus TaxID=193462 RepID=UPI003443FA17